MYLVAPENKLEDLAWYTLHGLLKMVHQTTEEEVAYAKAQLKTNYLNSLATLQGANDVRGWTDRRGVGLMHYLILLRPPFPLNSRHPTNPNPHPTPQNLGRQMLTYGRVMTPAEFFTRVDAVSVADVKAVADQVINDQDHALAAVGYVWVCVWVCGASGVSFFGRSIDLLIVSFFSLPHNVCNAIL